MTESLGPYCQAVLATVTVPWRGRVVEANGQCLVADGPPGRLGEACEIRSRAGARHQGQIIGFRGERVLLMLVDDGNGIACGDEVVALDRFPSLPVGHSLLGRVVNAQGVAIDKQGRLATSQMVALEAPPPGPFDRVPIDDLLPTGIRVIDGMLPIGKGQRIGIFGGSGVGKSTLLGMMTRNAGADIVVIGLVGERGREVIEFLDESLGPRGRARSVVVVATSDEAPLVKMRAALSATSIAEYFAASGKDVLLILDSLTRFAMAAREIGLAAGEPPTQKGYTPSVFTRLAKLVERAGRFRAGSITAFYTVLMEGDDDQDPIADTVRSLLDGHVMLSRDLASEGWYPPVDVLRSVSRLMEAVADGVHCSDAKAIRQQLAVYERSEDLIRIGAYKPGTDSALDHAIERRESLRRFLIQSSSSESALPATLTDLAGIARLPAKN